MKKDMQSWAAHVKAIEREAISVGAYAKREDVSVAALYYWRHKLRATAQGPAVAKQPGAFVQLRVAGQTSGHDGSGCTLVLASGLRLEMASLPAPEWLASLARAAHGVR